MFEEIHFTLESEPVLIAAQDIFVEAKNLHVVRLTYITTENIPNIILSDEHSEYAWRQIDDMNDIIAEPYLKEVLHTFISKNA